MFSGKRMEESAPTLNLADVRRIIEPLYEGQKLFTGESVMAHAEGVVDILRGIRDDDDLLAAAYLLCLEPAQKSEGMADQALRQTSLRTRRKS